MNWWVWVLIIIIVLVVVVAIVGGVMYSRKESPATEETMAP